MATAIYFQPAGHSAPIHGVLSASREHMGLRVVAINIAYCSLGGLVLSLLLRMGKNQNILFLLVREACVSTIHDAIIEKKKQPQR